jgi:hypothetical protein
MENTSFVPQVAGGSSKQLQEMLGLRYQIIATP